MKWRFEKMAAGMEEYYNWLDFRGVDDFDDEAFAYVMQKVKGVNMLDLNETDITNESIKLISGMRYVKELRIKGCEGITNDAIPFIRQISQLHYIHAKGTSITIDGLLRLGATDQFTQILFSNDNSDKSFDEKMSRLIRNLPNCEFVIDGKPYG